MAKVIINHFGQGYVGDLSGELHSLVLNSEKCKKQSKEFLLGLLKDQKAVLIN